MEWLRLVPELLEYILRGFVCRIFGHKWEEETEWAGDVKPFIGPLNRRVPQMNYAQNCLIKFPSGRWGFVGRVDARLCKPNGEQLSWNTKEAALEAASAIEAKVEYVEGTK